MTIGLDIGGANLKAAFVSAGENGDVIVCHDVQRPFPMWAQWRQLDAALSEQLQQAPRQSLGMVAVTMTGELADGFKNRRDGVFHIADCVERVFSGQRIVYYSCDGNWRSRDELDQYWDQVAAANWHATARWLARRLPSPPTLVVDMGTTTTDVSIIENGIVGSRSKNDLERLQNQELLYIGADRTPVCGLLNDVIYNSVKIPLANEFFATIGDCLIWKRATPEQQLETQTADGRPKTRINCGQRIARLLCRDLSDLESDLIDAIAEQTIESVKHQLTQLISAHVDRSDVNRAYILGQGRALVRQLFKASFPQIDLIDGTAGDAKNAPQTHPYTSPANAIAFLAMKELA